MIRELWSGIHWQLQASIGLLSMTVGTVGGISHGALWAAVVGIILTLAGSVMLARGVWRGF